MKYALLVGLSYPNTSYSLNAPIRDVNRIKDTLVGYEITLITDPLGSKENIVSCFLSLVKKKGTLFFYFSGHGQKEPEAIVCNNGVVTHDEFRDMLTHLDPEANLVAVIDSCFSGNLFDLTYRWGNEWILQGPPVGHVSLISSSLEGEVSLEYLTRTDSFGAFTRAYIHALQDKPTWRVLMEHITTHLNQTPVLTSGDEKIDQPFEI